VFSSISVTTLVPQKGGVGISISRLTISGASPVFMVLVLVYYDYILD
jgi:hypothetical protein